jgi:hypothetical protein
MRSLRYLNTVLTLIAILLTLNLWTLWTATASHPAAAIDLTAATPARAQARPPSGGIPDAGAQRREIADQIKLGNQKLDTLIEMFRSGQARVRLEAPPKEGE